MTNAIKYIAGGYLFLHLNINLGTLNLLPGWAGYLLIYRALEPLGEEQPSARLLKPLAILLGVWEGLQWLLTLLNVQAEFWILELIAGAIGLYFHFQLLTDLAAVAEQHGWAEHTKLLHLRTAQTLLSTFLLLPLPWEEFEALTVAVLLIHAAVLIWITAVLFGLKRFIQEE
ncbi:MAG: hypothetical protein IJ043_02550 [Clostridia bacterium]|nr:hypothetical protein [Clostridia bacterium]